MPEGYFILADAGPSGYFILCAALMVVLQLVALVCGIVGWRTASGKAGIAISIVSLALVVLAVWSLITTTHSEKSAPTTTVTDTVQSSPTVQRLPAPAAATAQKPAAKNTRRQAVPRPAGRQVAPTPAELAHILSELPKEYTKDLLGDEKQSVKDLDTQIWAIDFDDGPAEFWLRTHETGQETFPFRLPSRDQKETWRIPKAKAHILMWIQPFVSVSMSDRMRNMLGNVAAGPGCHLGIDVDGKSVARMDYRVPETGGGPFPDPLWFGWASKEMPSPDSEFAAEMGKRAIWFIGRESDVQGMNKSCQMALMYRRATSAGESPKGNQP